MHWIIEFFHFHLLRADFAIRYTPVPALALPCFCERASAWLIDECLCSSSVEASLDIACMLSKKLLPLHICLHPQIHSHYWV